MRELFSAMLIIFSILLVAYAGTKKAVWEVTEFKDGGVCKTEKIEVRRVK